MSGAGTNAILKRAEEAAEKRADALRARVRARIAAALPGVSLSEEDGRIRISGRGLVRRWVAEDGLRDLRGVER